MQHLTTNDLLVFNAQEKRAPRKRMKTSIKLPAEMKDLAIRPNLFFPPDALIAENQDLAIPVLRPSSDADRTAMEDKEV